MDMNISVEYVASVIMAQFFNCHLTLIMKTVGSSDILLLMYQTTRCRIPEGHHSYFRCYKPQFSARCTNLRSLQLYVFQLQFW